MARVAMWRYIVLSKAKTLYWCSPFVTNGKRAIRRSVCCRGVRSRACRPKTFRSGSKTKQQTTTDRCRATEPCDVGEFDRLSKLEWFSMGLSWGDHRPLDCG